MTITQIAQITHEANRAYCNTVGDTSQLSWDQAPDWQKDSAVNGVKFHLDHPDSKPEDSHWNWLEQKKADGWKYGAVKDPDKKEHPCYVPYQELPEFQRVKDYIFTSIVKAVTPFVEKT